MRYSVLTELKPLVEDKDEVEAVNLLLHFVQTAFSYKTDQDQFVTERFHPARPPGLDVIGLDYPGHVATAVGLKSEVSGDAVAHEGTRYIVCDPTYVNADVGMSIPKLASITPGVIPIE